MTAITDRERAQLTRRARRTAKKQLRAGIYTRVSRDKSGRARSPEEQEADSRRDCERQSFDVVEVYRDTDVGASRYTRKERPDFERAKDDIAAGAVDILVTWEASRLYRDTRIYEALATLCRAHGVRFMINGRIYDNDDPDDEFDLGLGALLAQREIGLTRRRVLRALRANAEQGRPHGQIRFGYRRIYDARTSAFIAQEADPELGIVVTECFRRAAAGEPRRQIATWLNENEWFGMRGGVWTGQGVSQMLASRSYLGERWHLGEMKAENAWPALIDEATWRAAQGQQRGSATHTRANILHPLSSVMKCAVCGGRIGAGSAGTRVNDQPRRNYRCVNMCVGRDQERIEGIMTDLVLTRLAQPNMLRAFEPTAAPTAGLRAELSALEARLAECEDDVVAGAISSGAFGRIEAKLQPKIDELREQLRVADQGIPPAVASLVGASDLHTAWSKLAPAVQRSVFSDLLADVTMHPIGRGRGKRSTQRLGITYRWVGSDEVFSL